jgi:hypothetical protein
VNLTARLTTIERWKREPLRAIAKWFPRFRNMGEFGCVNALPLGPRGKLNCDYAFHPNVVDRAAANTRDVRLTTLLKVLSEGKTFNRVGDLTAAIADYLRILNRFVGTD